MSAPAERVLVWLAWPEPCFRAKAADLGFLRSLLPPTAVLTSVGNERAFLRSLPEATHVIVWHFRPEWFALSPRLRLVATPAAGRELVPTTGPAGVRIHFGGFHGVIISETVLGFVLAWAHGLFAGGPRWPRERFAGHVKTLAGTTAVIAGYGRIGRAIGARLQPFGVRVYGLTRHGIFAGDGSRVRISRSRLLGRADWLIIALPGDTGSECFLGPQTIAALPARCVVVNVGRGNAIDEAALVDALKTGRLAGAYLDVFRGEPTVLARKSGRGWGLATARRVPPTLIRTPHASAFSADYLKLAFKELKDEGLI